MAGLVPAIHVFLERANGEVVDHRVKPGDDGLFFGRAPLNSDFDSVFKQPRATAHRTEAREVCRRPRAPNWRGEGRWSAARRNIVVVALRMALRGPCRSKRAPPCGAPPTCGPARSFTRTRGHGRGGEPPDAIRCGVLFRPRIRAELERDARIGGKAKAAHRRRFRAASSVPPHAASNSSS